MRNQLEDVQRMFVDFATQMETKNTTLTQEVDRLRELVDWLQYEVENGMGLSCPSAAWRPVPYGRTHLMWVDAPTFDAPMD